MKSATLPSVNVIGCGKVGKTIAHLFVKCGVATIAGVVNTRLETASAAVTFIGEGEAYSDISSLPPADIYLITTTDDQIACVAEALSLTLTQPAIVLHCSGVKTSAVLSPLKEKGCAIASVHPIKSFANPATLVDHFEGSICGTEGDAAALAVLTPLFQKIGGEVVAILPEQKRSYHAASVMANNYLVTLHYHAMQAYLQSGIEQNIAKKMVSSLMKDALTNAEQLSHEQALTGPIQRGDSHTLQAHLEALQSLPDTKAVYVAMGRGTLPLTTKAEAVSAVLSQAISSCDSDA